jgi:hypothetical protein
MKNSPRTRANRIKTLLAELRDLQRGINRAHAALAIWEKLTTDQQILHALGHMDSRILWSNYDLYYKVDRGEVTPADARQSCIEGATLAVGGPAGSSTSCTGSRSSGRCWVTCRAMMAS